MAEAVSRPGNIGPGNMNKLFRLFITATVLALAAGPASSAESLSETQKKEVEAVIQDYLLKNPEIITKGIEVLQARQREAEEKQSKAALVAQRSQLFDDPTSPVSGNPSGDITIKQLRSRFCKRASARPKRNNPRRRWSPNDRSCSMTRRIFQKVVLSTGSTLPIKIRYNTSEPIN